MKHRMGKGAKALRGKGELQLAFSAAVGDRFLASGAGHRISDDERL